MSPHDETPTPAAPPDGLTEHLRLWIELPRDMLERLHVMRVLTGRSVSELVEHCLASHMPELGELADQPLGKRPGADLGSV